MTNSAPHVIRTPAIRETTVVIIMLNGAARPVTAGTTISDLLAELQLDPRYLAVEVNRQVVPRGRHAVTLLCPDDHVEIVTLVGGG